MKREIHPAVFFVIIAIAVIAVGAWLYTKTQGTTFTKSSARGIQMDPAKLRSGGN